MHFFTLLAYSGLFIIVLVSLIFTSTEDSAGRQNNVLLMYYMATSVWVVGCVGAVVVQSLQAYAQFHAILKVAHQKRGAKAFAWTIINSHYSLILWGLIVFGIIYVLRRPEWSRMIIDAMSAWRSNRSTRYAEEILVQHALFHKEDREWAHKAISLLRTTDPKSDTQKSSSKSGGAPPKLVAAAPPVSEKDRDSH